VTWRELERGPWSWSSTARRRRGGLPDGAKGRSESCYPTGEVALPTLHWWTRRDASDGTRMVSGRFDQEECRDQVEAFKRKFDEFNDADPINRWSAEQTARFMELCKDTVTDWNHQDYWVSLRQDWLAEDYVPNPKAFLPPMQRGNDQSRDQRERKDTLQNMTHNKNDPLTCGQVDCLIEDLFLVLDDQAQRNKTVAP